MKNPRNHWRLVTVFALALLGVFAFLWNRAEARTSHFSFARMGGEPAYSPLNVVERDAIVSSLNDASLDRDALVALNLTSQQAETLLSTARTWQHNTQSTITAQMNVVHQKRRAVQAIEKAMAMGPFSENHATQLATARQELADAQAAYKTTLSGLESSISQGLSQSQQSTWTAVKTGWGQQMPIRMLDLSDEQRLAVSDAHQRYERQHSAASNDEERSAAVTTWTTALDSILTQNQKTLVQSYLSNYASASEAVANAYTTVLLLQEVVAQQN